VISVGCGGPVWQYEKIAVFTGEGFLAWGIAIVDIMGAVYCTKLHVIFMFIFVSICDFAIFHSFLAPFADLRKRMTSYVFCVLCWHFIRFRKLRVHRLLAALNSA